MPDGVGAEANNDGNIYLNDKVKKKSVIYFLMIILVFLCVKKIGNEQNEYFETYNSYVIQAKNRDKLRDHLIKKKIEVYNE